MKNILKETWAAGVSPETIAGYVKGKDMESLKAMLEKAEGMEILQAFYDLSSEEQVIVFRLLAKDNALEAVGINPIVQREHKRSSTLIGGGLFAIWKIRIPILLLVLLGGFVAGMIVEGFEEALEAVTMIAFFIPLIMDMGGSVGGQSTTIFARAFVLGHIKAGTFWKQFLKEAIVGLSIGAVVGFFAFFGVGVWLGSWNLALAVSLSLLANCLIASSAGFLVPYFLIKIKADQAAGSGPIITSIKDITGLLVYFGFVSLLLGAYI